MEDGRVAGLWGANILLLIRATRLTDRIVALADNMAAVSGQSVAFILDGRNSVTISTRYPMVMLTEDACAGLGLYCPYDFAWRCGDYGLYLARRQFPDETYFWLIEQDARIAGVNPENFFKFFADKPHDLLASQYGPSQRDWVWYYHACGRDVKTYGCLFSLLRLSARALDALLAKRVQHSGISHRRKMYPNDESFVGTTLTNGNFSCADLNAFGRAFYNAATASASNAIQGETLPTTGDPMFYHPVLWGDDYFGKTNVCNGARKKYGPVTAFKIAARKRLSTLVKW